MSEPGIRIDPTGPAGDELSFRADAVMPAQFYPARRGAASVEPIMRLMAGILIDAVRCFQRNFEARHSDRRRSSGKLSSGFSTTRQTDLFLSSACASRWRSIRAA